MVNWYNKVVSDLGKLPDFIDYYDKELVEAKKELQIKGLSIQRVAAQLPAIVETRYSQLQEIEAILEHINLIKYKTKSERIRHYMEHYNKQLTSRDAEKYAEGDKAYYDICVLANEVALLRNKFLAIHKGLDQKSWMLGHITRLKCAGLDDATF